MIKLILPFVLLVTAVTPSKCNKNSETAGNGRTKKECLVGHVWQLDEVRRNIGGKNSYYIRGGENTTGVSYDLMQLSFNDNGTGTYTDETGRVNETRWRFTSNNERNIELKVVSPYPVTYLWHLVEITENALHNTTFVGGDIIVSARFIPIQ